MANTRRIAIIAALEREVRPLVRGWKSIEHGKSGLKSFERNDAVVICGGIGQESARRAAEVAIAEYHPELLVSVGFAGSLDQSLRVGQVFWPGRVIDAKDNSRVEIASGKGALVSFPAVAGVEQKTKLANAYDAQAVDMEAAAVARAAQKHGTAFAAVKAISDERDFELPPMEGFVTESGQFRNAAFAWFALLRPWFWFDVVRLASNSSQASKALCLELERFLTEAERGTLKQLQATPGV